MYFSSRVAWQAIDGVLGFARDDLSERRAVWCNLIFSSSMRSVFNVHASNGGTNKVNIWKVKLFCVREFFRAEDFQHILIATHPAFGEMSFAKLTYRIHFSCNSGAHKYEQILWGWMRIAEGTTIIDWFRFMSEFFSRNEKKCICWANR